MNKYHILIEYVGTNFQGMANSKIWKNDSRNYSKEISKLLKGKIILIGSGRTDTGVHAIEQSAHFECKNKDY